LRGSIHWIYRGDSIRESAAVRSRELALVAFLAEADFVSAFAFATLANAAAFLERVDVVRPRPEISRCRDGRDDSVSVHSEISSVSIFWVGWVWGRALGVPKGSGVAETWIIGDCQGRGRDGFPD
jgi:hypothetical protein